MELYKRLRIFPKLRNRRWRTKASSADASWTIIPSEDDENLWISIGDEKFQSAAQTGYNYDSEDLEGKQVLCATDLGEVRIAGFKSEVLTVGVPDEEGNPVLVRPDKKVPEGGELY